MNPRQQLRTSTTLPTKHNLKTIKYKKKGQRKRKSAHTQPAPDTIKIIVIDINSPVLCPVSSIYPHLKDSTKKGWHRIPRARHLRPSRTAVHKTLNLFGVDEKNKGSNEPVAGVYIFIYTAGRPRARNKTKKRANGGHTREKKEGAPKPLHTSGHPARR